MLVPRPNIVYIISDDYTERKISAYANPLLRTPYLRPVNSNAIGESSIYPRHVSTMAIDGLERCVLRRVGTSADGLSNGFGGRKGSKCAPSPNGFHDIGIFDQFTNPGYVPPPREDVRFYREHNQEVDPSG